MIKETDFSERRRWMTAVFRYSILARFDHLYTKTV